MSKRPAGTGCCRGAIEYGRVTVGPLLPQVVHGCVSQGLPVLLAYRLALTVFSVLLMLGVWAHLIASSQGFIGGFGLAV